jgi:hypothetical protein
MDGAVDKLVPESQILVPFSPILGRNLTVFIQNFPIFVGTRFKFRDSSCREPYRLVRLFDKTPYEKAESSVSWINDHWRFASTALFGMQGMTGMELQWQA